MEVKLFQDKGKNPGDGCCQTSRGMRVLAGGEKDPTASGGSGLGSTQRDLTLLTRPPTGLLLAGTSLSPYRAKWFLLQSE